MHIQSGTEFGVTLGTPIGLLVQNEDQRPKDYGGGSMDMFPRPSHADWTYLEKYGVKASSGGGRSSARETIGVSFVVALMLGFNRAFVLTMVVGRACGSRSYCGQVFEASSRCRNHRLRLLRWPHSSLQILLLPRTICQSRVPCASRSG